MSTYRRPLARGGHVIQSRDGNGKFQRHPSLGGIVCPNDDCRRFAFPETVNEGTEAFPFLRSRYPTHCKACGTELVK